MKTFLLLALSLLLSLATYAQKRECMNLFKRVTKNNSLPIKVKIKERDNETYYNYAVVDGKLTIEGNSPTSITKGFYDYVKSNGYGIYSWSGNNINIPTKLDDCDNCEVISPVKHHYMSNVVVYGYTKPYWDWERWEREIDWMALHGIDMPLALVGYEAIIARVWKKMGLTNEEIDNYFVGAAHLPWMRMGNASGIDAPLNEDWYNSQIALQHKILKRMRSLGMKPISLGFAGFVPEAFKRIYPDIELVKTHWAGAFHNWMISPENDLFGEIATEFIKEWEKEFGEGEYYLVDSFNEMEIPFPPKDSEERYKLLASYGDKVYRSIERGNPNAKWVMQGWMFGYQRNIWDTKTLAALISKVPNNKMVLLDLAVDYNKHFWHSEVNWEFYKGFFGKEWVYSIIPNMGGKTGMTGILEFYANGHLEALKSPHKGELLAIGMAPEGLENNEVIYELFADASWSNKKIDLDEWLKNYSINRYGAYTEELDSYWKLIRKSVYGSFTDHPRYNWQLRPGLVSKGTINISDDFFKAIEMFVSAAPKLKNAPLYLADFRELVALYIGGKVEKLIYNIEECYKSGDIEGATINEALFNKLMIGMDMLLEGHPTLRLDSWLDYAKNAASDSQQEEQYVTNAKRLISIWGPPIDDYSARVWSGLIRDYYLPRWKHYFASKKSGKSFDFATWEKEWVETNNPLSKVTPPEDIISFGKELINDSFNIR